MEAAVILTLSSLALSPIPGAAGVQTVTYSSRGCNFLLPMSQTHATRAPQPDFQHVASKYRGQRITTARYSSSYLFVNSASFCCTHWFDGLHRKRYEKDRDAEDWWSYAAKRMAKHVETNGREGGSPHN